MTTAVPIVDITEQAKEQLAQITGFKPVAVVAVFKDDTGWHVTVDMLEMTRIPESSDLLGIYETTLDAEGNVVSFERKMTHNRADILEPEEAP